MEISRTTRHRAVRIAFFNHKGGVGKTLLTANLACILADLGKQVLLVDSDPQCNLTSFFIEDSVVDKLLDSSDKSNGQTLWTALKPLVEAEGDAHIVETIERRENLRIIPGDIRLAEYEAELHTFWSECLQRKLRGFRATTALGAVVNELSRNHKIDYVLYDCGPNIGPLNRIILLDADFFIVPAACDLFSSRAIRTLGKALSSWISEWEIISKLAPQDVQLLPGRPRLMGYVPQRYRVYGRAPTHSHAHYISKIERAVGTDLATVLKKIHPSLVPFTRHRVGEVRDFGTLASTAQTLGLPIFDLPSATPTQLSDARATFEALAREIILRSRQKGSSK